MPHRLSLPVTVVIGVVAILAAGIVVASEQTPSLFFAQTPETLKGKIVTALKCDWTTAPGSCAAPHTINVKVLKNGLLSGLEIYADRASDPDEARETPASKVEQEALLKILVALFPTWKEAHPWLSNALDKTVDRRYETCIRVGDASIYVRQDQGSDRDEAVSYVVITPTDYIGDFKRLATWEKDYGLDTCSEFSPDGRKLGGAG